MGVYILHPIKVSFNLGDGFKSEKIKMEKVLFRAAIKGKKGVIGYSFWSSM